MASIQVTEGLLMDLGWEITAKNGRTVSVEPPQDSKLLGGMACICRVRRVCRTLSVLPSLPVSLLCNEMRKA